MTWAALATAADTLPPPQHAPLAPVLGALVLILLGGRLGGIAFERMRLPAVIGELLAGILLGNIGLIGWHGLEPLLAAPALDVLAQIGVLFLLFEVGLDTDLGRMLAVGRSSLLVATLGVIAPMLLGFAVSRAFFPAHPTLVHWFVGATLCATSVGISARVLSDLRRADSPEGRIILGAAMIDDVLGLLVLAMVTGVISAANEGRPFAAGAVAWIAAKSALFLGGAIGIGRWLSRPVFRLAAALQGEAVLLSLALAFCFLLALLAQWAGLAPIVGAFSAGLILDELRTATPRGQSGRTVPEMLRPLTAFLVPVFFVLMGVRVQLAALARPELLGFAAALTAAAVAGKQACSLGVLERGADRLAIGLGMIPRGEVGLIFAGIGSTLALGAARVVDAGVYAAVVAMVAFTTLLTPPLLAWRLQRRR